MRSMVRVARRFICLIETEWITCSYVFARNYGRVFERLGAEQVRARITPDSIPGPLGDAYVGYVARLFRIADR